jgi:hypothetical protein
MTTFIITPVTPPAVIPGAISPRNGYRTWLSIQRWAQLMGIDMLHFNQLNSATLQRTVCGSVWYQFAWQDANRTSREDVMRAIAQAEQRISNFIGYPLLPTWYADEEHRPVRPARADAISLGLNIRGVAKTIRAGQGYVLAGGVQGKTLLSAALVFVRSDEDGDGYKETCTANVAVTSAYTAQEIRAFYPGQNGDDYWEIRPIKVTISGLIATIVFNSWQIVDPSLQDSYSAAPIEADTDGNYLNNIDVYRVYLDPSQQVLFLWENDPCDCGVTGCADCEYTAQYGCLSVRDNRLGNLAYRPATWNATTESFDSAAWSVGRDPDKMQLSYLAGWQFPGSSTPMTQMDPFWELTVAYYAAALLDRNICECTNIVNFVEAWRQDLTRSDDQGSFQITEKVLANPFGQTRGALYARERCMDEGRRIAA